MNEIVLYKIFLDYFKGREECFASQGKEYYYPIQTKLTNEYLIKHFSQLATFGVYVLTSDSKCNFVCIDIDISKHELETVNFRNFKDKYAYLKNKLDEILELLNKEFKIDKDEILIEETGGRGFHIWLFFCEPVSGNKAVSFYRILKSIIKFDFEFFPKQGCLNEKIKLGNLIKLPLGVHQKYETPSYFFEILEEEVRSYSTIEGNISYLSQIKKLTSKKLQDIIDKYPVVARADKAEKVSYEKYIQQERNLYKKDLDYLFNHCKALNELKEKAEKGIQFSNNEAFHFTNLALSIKDSENFIIEILKKSFGSKYRPDTTWKEIESIKPLYPSSCQKLISQKICKGYCNEEILKKNEDNLLPNTNPIEFWLTKIDRPETINKNNIVQLIAEPKNIINTYWKLKRYHRDEDVGAYDEFDFEYFEKNLEINARYISRAIEMREIIPFIGYLKINVPKKLDEEQRMQYRQMTYSTIYDQVVIQAIFNVITKLLEKNFSDCSYGYRTDAKNKATDEIFNDWREYYPKFRNKVLSNLRQENIKYYICCDIKGFYDNVKHNLLIEQIKGYIDDQYILTILEKIIRMYHFSDSSGTGVPQGPAYARILANLYLNDFDREIQNYSAGFIRYVDDFFLFYESKELAEEGLKKVYELLNNIGLTLSDDEEKKPEILESTDEAKIITKLDSIQYGIFEEFKFIDYLDMQKLDNFYNAITTHYKVLTNNYDEILEINNKLPSILYLLSKKKSQYHSIEIQIPEIVNYLVENNVFYPKRLKYIFFELIDLINQQGTNICKFYEKLDNAHKVHFLLSLYRKYEKEGKYKQELLDVVKQSLENEDFYVNGFGLSISNKLFGKNKLDVINKVYIDKILNSSSYFSKLKLFDSINYLMINAESKTILRCHVNNCSSYIEKKYLLSNSQSPSIDIIDSTFFGNLLSTNSFFLFTECCELFASLRDNTSLFKIIENHFSSIPNYKDLIIYHLTALIYEKYKDAGTNDLENLAELYKQIKDEELKREVINVIERIQNLSYYSENEFTLNHRIINRYNQCSYYINDKAENREYDYIEIIPQVQLLTYEYIDLEKLHNALQNASYERIIPKLKFEIDSKRKQVLLKYANTEGFIELKDQEFELNKNSILFAFQLVSDLYKKTRYFYQKFGKMPLISKDHLLINPSQKKVQFKNIGSLLCPAHYIDGKFLNNSNEQTIPIMISCLLKDLFFLNDQEKVKKFLSKSSIGMELVLSHFISRLSSKKPYTYDRFSYIIQKLNRLSDSDFEISNTYFKERLKSLLYDKNETINWFSICGALNDLYFEFAKTYDEIDFKKIDFRDKIFFNFVLPKNLHHLSQMILNLSLNYDNIIKIHDSPRDFVEIVELLNYYAIFCIEVMSFYKVSINGKVKKIDESLLIDELLIKAKGCEQKYSKHDIEIIRALVRKKNVGKDIFNETNIFTLKQISLFYLLIFFNVEINEGVIEIKNGENSLKENKFDSLVFNLLIRLPQIENDVVIHISSLLDALRTNLDYEIKEEKVLKLKSNILVFCKDINKIRKAMKFKRYNGLLKIDKLPMIYCKRPAIKEYRAERVTLDKIPLTNRFPSSADKCSWDMSEDTVKNLVIPNEKINLLSSNLKSGKLFGYKITYLYSEKAKLIWDLCLILSFFPLFIFCNYNADNPIKSIFVSTCWFGRYLSAGLMLALLGKAIFKDAKYWSENYDKIIDYIKE